MQRDLHTCKETYTHAKRPTHIKETYTYQRDLHISKRHTHMQRDLHTWKKFYKKDILTSLWACKETYAYAKYMKEVPQKRRNDSLSYLSLGVQWRTVYRYIYKWKEAYRYARRDLLTKRDILTLSAVSLSRHATLSAVSLSRHATPWCAVYACVKKPQKSYTNERRPVKEPFDL